MRGLPALTVLTLLANPTLASPERVHDAFRDRCLAPLETLHYPDTRGLTQRADLPGWWAGQDSALAFDLGGGAQLVVTTDLPLICAVGMDHKTPDVEQTFAQWHANPRPDTPYIRLNPTTWESFEWREPRLQVGLDGGGEGAGAFVYVHETDLEA